MAAEGFERFVLANGLEVVLCRDDSLPVVTSMLWYRVGSAQELPGSTGVSHFLEHMLFKGSRHFGKGEIDALTLGCGGANNAFTWLDATTYYFSLPSSQWELALRIEADRMQGALLDPAEIEAERQVILEEWQSAQDDPDELFWEQLNALALQRHPYRRPVLGWAEDIRRLDRETIEAHYRRYYHPNHATLVLVGDLPADAEAKIADILGPLPAGPEPRLPDWHEPLNGGEKRLWLTREDVQLPRLSVCWPAPALADADYPPMRMLQYLLAEGWSSRLHQALVESRPLASEVGAMLFETRDPYLFWIQVDLCGLTPAAEVEAALFAEIERIQAQGPDLAEFERIRNQLLTAFYLQQETTEGRAEFAGERLTSGNWELLRQDHLRLEAVTAAAIQQVARRWLRADRRTIGWLWPSEEDPEAEAVPRRPPAGPREHHEPGIQTIPALAGSVELPEPHLPRLEVARCQLDNGLTALLHTQVKTPTFSLLCWLPAGSQLDEPGRRGLANLTLSSLIKGTRQRDARRFSEAVEGFGADLSLSAGLTGVSLEIEGLGRHFEPLLALLQETLLQPELSDAEITREQHLIQADLQASRENAAYLAACALAEVIYGQTAAAFPAEGSLASVTGLNPDDVRAFYRHHYGPQGCVLAVAGAIETAAASASIRQAFGDWRGGALATAVPELQRQRDFVYRHLPLPGRDQCTLLLGHLGVPRQHPDFPALLLLDVLLGSGPGFAARIPRRLRDERGLAYYLYHSSTQGASLWPGLVQAEIETSPERALACVQGVLDEIRAVQQDGVSAAELAAAKAYLMGRFAFLFETNVQRTGYLLQRQIYGWPEDFLNQHLAALEGLEPADIQAAAQRHLDTRCYTLISAGPRPEWNEDRLATL